MKNQTLSIEQMKHLKDLGVDASKASMVYHTYKDITDEWVEMDDVISSHFKIDENSEAITSLDIRSSEERLYHDMNDCSNYSCCEIIPAFTLQDMLEMMPKSMINNGIDYNLSIYGNFVSYSHFENGNHKHDIAFIKCKYGLLDGVYQALCWLAENNHLNKKP